MVRAAGSDAMPAVSVVVPTRNRAALLPGLLKALDEQTYPDYEVIVVDDASDDETPDLLAAWAREDRLVLRLARPSGSYLARNVGWRLARGEIVAFTDDDCLPSPGWLTGLVTALREPGSVGAQGVTLAQPGEITPFTHQIEQLRPGAPYRTCNIAYGRDVLQRLGGFEPMRWYADNILGLRARQEGTIAFAPDALVLHPPRQRDWRDRRTWLARFDADAVHRRWLRQLGEERVTLGERGLPIALWVLRPLIKQSLAHVRYLLRHPIRYGGAIRPMAWEKRELVAALRELRRTEPKRQCQTLPPLPEKPLVSVVVVTRDRPNSLSRTLASLNRQTYPRREIVVVDHAPAGSARRVAEGAGARWIAAPGGTLASARQRGVDATSGEVVAFTDDDCLPARGWLEALVVTFRQEPSDWGVQGRTTAEAGPAGMHAIVVQHHDPLYHTCNIAYRRTAIDAAGGFDERFHGWFEDTALGARVTRHGCIGFSPEALVIHRAMPRHVLDRDTWRRILADERLLADAYPAFYRNTRGPGFILTVIARWMVGSPLKTLARELPRSVRDPAAYWSLCRALVRERVMLAAALMDMLLASERKYSGKGLSAPAPDVERVAQTVAEK